MKKTEALKYFLSILQERGNSHISEEAYKEICRRIKNMCEPISKIDIENLIN
jgi:NADPH-dependent 7-cyano-7-deazaguanine reductase QueF